ncbi:MAG: hypothetical protein ABR521_14705 [Gaiellaceae bacterium]
MPRLPAWTFSTAAALYLAALLAVDRFVDLRWQLALGAATFGALFLASRACTADERLRVVVVVATATCFEVVGSVLWGVYTYRLGNLPLFVPPAHGLVYLTGLAISRTELVRRRPAPFVAGVIAFACGWAAVGLSGVLGRTDALGAFGVLFFTCVLLRSGAPTVLAGVFVVVAALELYGTALGAWTWAPVVPGLGVPNGNPPSGAASGYVLFEVAAFAAAPWLGARLLWRRREARGAACGA